MRIVRVLYNPPRGNSGREHGVTNATRANSIRFVRLQNIKNSSRLSSDSFHSSVILVLDFANNSPSLSPFRSALLPFSDFSSRRQLRLMRSIILGKLLNLSKATIDLGSLVILDHRENNVPRADAEKHAIRTKQVSTTVLPHVLYPTFKERGHGVQVKTRAKESPYNSAAPSTALACVSFNSGSQNSREDPAVMKVLILLLASASRAKVTSHQRALSSSSTRRKMMGFDFAGMRGINHLATGR